MLSMMRGTYVEVTDEGLFDCGGFPLNAEAVQQVLAAAQRASSWTDSQRDALMAEAEARWEREMFPGPERAPRPPRPGYVYLMRDARSGYTKIGFSIDPSRRERTLQSEVPDVRLLCCWAGTRGDERALHQRFQEKRVRGEWFDLTDAEIEAIGLQSLEAA